MPPPLTLRNNTFADPGPILRLAQRKTAMQVRLVRGVATSVESIGKMSPQRRQVVTRPRAEQVACRGRDGGEKLQPPGHVFDGPIQIIQRSDELIECRQIRMIGRLNIQAIELPLTQTDIGDALGLTKVHVNRTFREMEERGMIARSGKRVTMLDDADS